MLINCIKPYKMESLSGYLNRLRQVNYYEEQLWYLDLIPYQLNEHIDGLTDLSIYESLVKITNLSIPEIYHMTIHSVSHLYIPFSEELLLDIKRSFWKKSRKTNFVKAVKFNKICPYCWARYGTLFIPWYLRNTTTCFVHKNLLIDRCSECRRTLMVDIKKESCKSCGYKLNNMTSQFASTNICYSNKISFMFNLSDKVSQENDIPIFDKIPTNQLIPFIWKLYLLLRFHDPNNPYFAEFCNKKGINTYNDIRALDIKIIHKITNAMIDFLKDWPQSWNESLIRILEKEVKHKLMPFPLYFNSRFPINAWQFIHEEWALFVSENMYQDESILPWLRYYRDFHKRTISTQIRRIFSKMEGINELGVSGKVLEFYVDKGVLQSTVRPSYKSSKTIRFFDAQDVDELKRKRANYLYLYEVEQVLGISKNNILRACLETRE